MNKRNLFYIIIMIILQSCASPNYDLLSLYNDVSITKEKSDSNLIFTNLIINYKYAFEDYFKKRFDINVMINTNYQVMLARYLDDGKLFNRYEKIYILQINEKDTGYLINDIKRLNLEPYYHGTEGSFGFSTFEIEIFSNQFYPLQTNFFSGYHFYTKSKGDEFTTLLTKYLKKKGWAKVTDLNNIISYEMEERRKIREKNKQTKSN